MRLKYLTVLKRKKEFSKTSLGKKLKLLALVDLLKIDPNNVYPGTI